MRKYNSKNERIKHEYAKYLAEADGKSQSTIDGVNKSLLRFEQYAQFKDFSTFNRHQAIAFKKHLSQTKAKQSGKVLSKATVLSTLNNLKAFFKWLGQQRGYKSKIHLPDISYLNLTDKEVRAAKSSKIKKFPTVEQIERVISIMPTTNEVEMRNRALIAFTILTGIRIQAITSLKLKHIDLDQDLVIQDPREVKTKFSKYINTFFFPVSNSIRQIVIEWVYYLQKEKLYGYDAPLFPKTHIQLDTQMSFQVGGLEPKHWTTTSPARKIFREAFEAAGLHYCNPHSFRSTLGHLMQRKCKNIEEVLAWSQNLGHETPTTTFTSYGQIDPYRQGEIIKSQSKL